MRTHLDLFSGVGGFSLAARWAGGIETIGFAEIDEYCSKILEKHWPGVPNYDDVRTIPCDKLAGRVWLVTGGPPCQPFSLAGDRRGKSDERHLWPAMRDVVEKVRPAWCLVENVPGIIGMVLSDMQSDLETLGYQQQAFIVPACAVGANHRRDRIWIIAHAHIDKRTRECVRLFRWKPGKANSYPDRRAGDSVSYVNCQGLPASGEHSEAARAPRGEHVHPIASGFPGREAYPDLLRDVHGIPKRMDRIRALGNSIVPKIAEKFIRWMREAEEQA